MKRTVKEAGAGVAKLEATKLPGKTTLKKLVSTASSSKDNAYVQFYNHDVKETEDASKTLKRLNEQSQAKKYAKYSI